MGPQKGRKVFTLQSLPPRLDTPRESDRVAKQAGFSLHAGVMAEPHQRDVLERLCRYISRPAVSEKRLALTNNGKVRYELKTPYRDGTTHVFFDPLDFIARLAALVWQTACKTACEPDAVPRDFRAEQQASGTGHASQKRQGKETRRTGVLRKDRCRTPQGHDLDATIEARFQH